MNAQDLEQRALEFLAAEYERDGRPSDADFTRGGLPVCDADIRALRAIAAALRQQPAPVDLEQFREIAEGLRLADQFFDGDDNHWQWDDGEAFPASKVRAAYNRLLSIIDSAGKVEVLARGWFHRLPDGDYDIHDAASGAGKDCDGCIPCLIVAQDAAHQPAPVVDTAMRKLIAEGWNMVATARHTGEPIDAERLAAALARAQGVQS